MELNGAVYLAEDYVSGALVRYSTSGAKDIAQRRNTLEAFSCFTMKESKKRLVVTDLEGINNMYTHPVIHSTKGEWGDSDLGDGGIALFQRLHSHNGICKKLGLCKEKEVMVMSGTMLN